MTSGANGDTLPRDMPPVLSRMLTLAFAASVLVGCGRAARLTSTSTDASRSFESHYAEAIARRSGAGEYTILLEDNGLRGSGQSGGALAPARSLPLAQSMVIRVLWRPMKGTRTDIPSATNALVDWYVWPGGGDPRAQVVHYRGAGFVRVRPSGDRVKVDVRGATLRPQRVLGGMSDPLGEHVVSGAFTAVRADARTEGRLRFLEQLGAAAP